MTRILMDQILYNAIEATLDARVGIVPRGRAYGHPRAAAGSGIRALL